MNNFLLFFNISGGEILLIIIVIYLVFGPKKIPEFARMIGKGINEMRRATNDIRSEITREANKVKSDIGIDIDDPFKTERKTNTPPPKSSADPYNLDKEEVAQEEEKEKTKTKPKPKEKKSDKKPPKKKSDQSDLK